MVCVEKPVTTEVHVSGEKEKSKTSRPSTQDNKIKSGRRETAHSGSTDAPKRTSSA